MCYSVIFKILAIFLVIYTFSKKYFTLNITKYQMKNKAIKKVLI